MADPNPKAESATDVDGAVADSNVTELHTVASATEEELDEEEQEFRALRRDLPGVKGASSAGIVAISVGKTPGTTLRGFRPNRLRATLTAPTLQPSAAAMTAALSPFKYFVSPARDADGLPATASPPMRKRKRAPAPHWRLTEVGYMHDLPTQDWNGKLFHKSENQNPVRKTRTGRPKNPDITVSEKPGHLRAKLSEKPGHTDARACPKNPDISRLTTYPTEKSAEESAANEDEEP